MGSQIIRQPSGKYAIFSTYTDTIIVWDATEDEIINHYAELAAERIQRAALFRDPGESITSAVEQARADARRRLGHVAAGNPRKAYYQFAMSWQEALEEDREHDGTAWKVAHDRGE